jgi:hypothetical protein
MSKYKGKKIINHANNNDKSKKKSSMISIHKHEKKDKIFHLK